MALQRRFERTAQGALVVTGNSLVIWRNTFISAMYPQGEVSALISTDLNNQVPGFPQGTTLDYTKASSSAQLNIPEESNILFAQLTWVCAEPPPGTENNPIRFKSPTGMYIVSPDLSLSQETPGYRYWRAADVKNLVQSGGSGTYTCGAIPTSAPTWAKIGASNWTLIVVYENKNFPLRYFNINTGFQVISKSNPLTNKFNNFITPSIGNVKGYIVMTLQDGDSRDEAVLRVGENIPDIEIGNESNPWNGIPPYNKKGNLFTSLICIGDTNSPNIGLLDSRGSFGYYNYDPYTNLMSHYGRICYDIGGFDISYLLSNNQKSLYTNLTLGSLGGAFVTSESLQIDTISLTELDMPKEVLEESIDKVTVKSNSKLVENYGLIPTAIPASGYVDIQGTFIYSFTPYVGAVASQKSVDVQSKRIYINTANLSIASSVDKNYADIGDIVTKTVVVTVTGSTTANNVIISDTIPSGSTLVPNSLRLNGSVVAGADPNLGYTISTLNIGVSTITYQTTIVTIPNTNPMTSTVIGRYSYTVDPATPNTKNKSTSSNTVSTEVNHADLVSTLNADRSTTVVGDVVTYTIPIKVTGNTNAINISLASNIPTGTNLVENSVTINGAVQSGVTPTSIPVGTINFGQTTTISFKVNVTTIPPSQTITNSATVSYSYTVDPASPGSKSSTSSTNIVNINVSKLQVTTTKSVDKVGATIGDNIKYSIVVVNSGDVNINNVKLLDTIPTGVAFITDSVKINGISQGGSNPNPPTGITIGTVNSNSTTTVDFGVTVNTVPSGNVITNIGTVGYNYTVNPLVPNGESGSSNTNTVSTQVIQSGLTASKSVDKTSATLGDTITYTIVLSNTGNVQLTNVNLIDTIPNGGSLVANSVTINGTPQTGVNPGNLSISSIATGSVSTVTFQIKVDSIPVSNSFVNSASISYNYTVDPANPNGGSGGVNTNSVNTNLGQATLTAVKSVNKAGAGVGEELTYTVVIKNTGNISANLVTLVDTIPNGSTFVANSVTINGSTQGAATPVAPNGISLGTISANQTTTVQFKTQVTSIPNPSTLNNKASIYYKYTSDPSSPNSVSGFVESNSVSTAIYQANINAVKTVDKQGAALGNTLIYSIAISNTGNTSINNVKLYDTIPNGTNFVTNSVQINGLAQSGATPIPGTGITVGSVAPSTTTTVSFSVTVVTIPSGNSISNSATISYNYTTDPSVPNGASGSVNTGIVNTSVGQITFNAVKSVNKSLATLGEEIGYTIALKNLGNTGASNILVVDTLPSSISFVNGSVQVNGSAQGSMTPNNISIPSISSGQTATVTFKATVISIPNPNTITNSAYVGYKYTVDPLNPNGESGSTTTNSVSSNLGQVTLNAIKYVDKVGVAVGDIVTYTIVLTNTGNLVANTVVFKDTIPTGMTFNSNTVKVNGSLLAGAIPSGTGVSVGTINSGATATIEFKATVNTIPSPSTIINTGTAIYNYTIDPSTPNSGIGGANTNSVSTSVGAATVNLTKSVDKTTAALGDKLTYYTAIKNLGNISVNDVIFIDTIPNGTTFVNGSVSIDGVSQLGGSISPPLGLQVGNISSGTVKTISYDVNIGTINNNILTSAASFVSYKYTLDPSVPNGKGSEGLSNTVDTAISRVDLNVVKSVDKSGATIGDEINYTLGLKNTGNVSADNVTITDTTPNGTAFVTNSLKLNGIIKTGETTNPPGYNLGSIPANTLYTVTFKVTVITLPSPNIITNNAAVAYNFSVGSTTKNNNTISNDVLTTIGRAELNSIKSVDKVGATIGDTLRYTISINNTGNIVANSVRLKDTIPNGTTFVNDSVIVNGIPQLSVNPELSNGISVGNINVGETAIVVFNVKVIQAPTTNMIKNIANMTFSYRPNPAMATGVPGNSTTNEVVTNIGQAQLKAVKTIDKIGATIGDVINYRIVLKNTGNIPANEVTISDTIPGEMLFILNSVKVNEVDRSGLDPNPPSGMVIGSIGSQETATITFQVTVETMPLNNPILNSATIKYKYSSDPSIPNSSLGSINTNTVAIRIGEAKITVNKLVDKVVAKINDEIFYSLILKNIGNIAAQKIRIIDTIPEGGSFVSNSLKVDGSILMGQTMGEPGGVLVGTLPAGSTMTVGFKVAVVTIPSLVKMDNNSSVNYEYFPDPSIPTGILAGTSSNKVTTQLKQIELKVEKSVDKNSVKLGEQLNYSVLVKNTGNVTANNIIFIDTIPSGIELVANSVNVNGVIRNINTLSASSPLDLGLLLSGNIITVTFAVTVITIPTTGEIINNALINYKYSVDPSNPVLLAGSVISNSVTITAKQPIIDYKSGRGMVKSVDKAYAELNDVLTYRISLKNTGNLDALNVVLIDTIPEGITFMKDSLERNGQQLIGQSPDAPLGANIGTIRVGSTLNISFKGTVNNYLSDNKIINNSTVGFQYSTSSMMPQETAGGNSNSVITTIRFAKISKDDNSLVMTVDKMNVSIGDLLTYSTKLTNTGNIDAESVMFLDTIPKGTTFVNQSVLIDGVLQSGSNPAFGVNVGSIPPGITRMVVFKVKVNAEGNFQPIINSGRVSYNYTVDPSRPSLSVINNTNEVSSGVKVAIISRDAGGIKQYVDKEYSTLEEILTYTLVLKNTGNIDANNVRLIKMLPQYANLVSNTIYIDGVFAEDVQDGLLVGDAQPQIPITITYKVRVSNKWDNRMRKLANIVDVYYEYTVE